MPDNELLDLMDDAAISFVATVERIGEATVADVPVDERTAVVRVSQVLHAPAALAGIADTEVTVQLAPDDPPLEPGSEAMFFADPIAFDTGIAVREVARRPVDTAQDAVRAATLAPDPTPQVFALQLEQRRLQQHAAEADAVVRATVMGLEKVGSLPLREHGPDYWRATMSVSHVERGVVQGDQIQVLYINSLDVRHRLSPKPRASQEGIWLLHATQGPLRDLASWMIPDPEDFQPVENLEVIQNAS